MAVSVSMVMASGDETLSDADLGSFLRESWPELPPLADFSEKDGVFSFSIGPSKVFFAKMPGPIPWHDLEGPCATSVLWKNATEEIRAHKFHWLVTVASDLNNLERSSLLTQVTASLMHSCQNTIGVYWGNATLVVPKGLFIDFATEILPQGPPLHIWIDFRVGTNSEDSSWGFTAGMAALGHMEFEAEDAPEPPKQLRDRLYDLADYVLDKGPVIKDGHTVGADADEQIRVIYTQSVFGHKGRVIRLNYEKASPKSPWWKFW